MITLKKLICSTAAGVLILTGCSKSEENHNQADNLNIELPLKTNTLAPYDTDVPVSIGAAETLFKTSSDGKI